MRCRWIYLIRTQLFTLMSSHWYHSTHGQIQEAQGSINRCTRHLMYWSLTFSFCKTAALTAYREALMSNAETEPHPCWIIWSAVCHWWYTSVNSVWDVRMSHGCILSAVLSLECILYLHSSKHETAAHVGNMHIGQSLKTIDHWNLLVNRVCS